MIAAPGVKGILTQAARLSTMVMVRALPCPNLYGYSLRVVHGLSTV